MLMPASAFDAARRSDYLRAMRACLRRGVRAIDYRAHLRALRVDALLRTP